MGKLDTMFHEIISYDEFVEKYDYNPDDYQKISVGCNSSNQYVRAIANMLLDLDKLVEDKKMDMRIKHQTGKVVIDQSAWDAIYRKLNKNLEKTEE